MIDVRDLFCLYTVPGGATVAALRGLSLQVGSGERVVLHGPNGSGKTTLLRVLTGEVAASAGQAVVAGSDVAGASPRRVAGLRRTVLGLVDQHSGRTLRPELDVLDNVALQVRLAGRPRTAARAAAMTALDGLGLGELSGRRPATLSAGEAQRVAVCAAVVHEPTVLLADEPTGELDVAAADAVYDLLARAAGRSGAALLLVTHDVRAARVAERVVRIRDGRLSEQWRPETPDDELQVVDDRGWLRLPGAVRDRVGGTARARLDGERVVLTASGAPTATDDAVRRVAATELPAPVERLDGPVARLAGVRVHFGERVVLDGVDLEVSAGALTVVRGRSGSGKSTVLRLLVGLADPDGGTVELGGVDLGPRGRAARAGVRGRVVGVSSQSGALAEPLDTWENLSLARTARGLGGEREVVAGFVDALGLEAVSRRPVRLLSGGERQRVALARSLVVQRPLVVLDEPTSQQDEAHAELVTAVLVAAARAGTAVVCATHDPVLAAAADHILDLA